MSGSHMTKSKHFHWVKLVWGKTIEIIGEDFISRLYALANLRENKVLANKKCFTVLLQTK